MYREQRQGRREEREREKAEKEETERGPPTHAVLYDEQNRSCGRVPVMFGLVPSIALSGGGVGPALVAHEPPPPSTAPQVHKPLARPVSSRAPPHKHSATAPSRPSSGKSRDSQPSNESYQTARGIAPSKGRSRPRPLSAQAPESQNTGFDGRYPPQQQRERKPIPTMTPQHLNKPVPPLPPSPATDDPRKHDLDALIAAQICSSGPIPGVFQSNPPRDNKWDDVFATALFGRAYSSLAYEEKKDVQRAKIKRGAQIAASGTKGYAREKAEKTQERLKMFKKGEKEKVYSQEDYERDAGVKVNEYAIYADQKESAYGTVPAAPPNARTWQGVMITPTPVSGHHMMSSTPLGPKVRGLARPPIPSFSRGTSRGVEG